MDYVNRRQLKILGHVCVQEVGALDAESIAPGGHLEKLVQRMASFDLRYFGHEIPQYDCN